MALLLQLTQKLAHGFQAFWDRWPRKVAKVEAEKAWKKHVRPEDEAPIHAALDWQVPMFEAREPEYRPHAATWIRGRRWEDERPTTTPSRPTAKPLPLWQQKHMTAAEQTQEVIRLMRDEGLTREEAIAKVFQ
jgi:hypothetical protein